MSTQRPDWYDEAWIILDLQGGVKNPHIAANEIARRLNAQEVEYTESELVGVVKDYIAKHGYAFKEEQA